MNVHHCSSFRLAVGLVGCLLLTLPVTPLTATSSGACKHDNSTLVETVEKMFNLEESRKQGRYLIFNHERGIIAKPVPATLQVRDGETFTILFACTSPDDFDYRIEMIPDDQVSNSTFRDGIEHVQVEELENAVSVTWRHDEQFALYRVSVTQRQPGTVLQEVSRQDLQDLAMEIPGLTQKDASRVADNLDAPMTDEMLKSQAQCLEVDVDSLTSFRRRVADKYALASYTFPVWVRTVGWDLSFSSGFGFSGLENPKFNLETVTTDTGDQMMVRRDRDAEDEFRPDLMALANLRFPDDGPAFFRPLGLSFGVGIGQDAEPRYYFGPSIDLGKSFILTAGVAGGKVDALPTGQQVDGVAINGGSTLDTLPKRFETTWFAGIAFRFSSAGVQNEFLGRLSGVQKQPTSQTTAPETEATDKLESALEEIKQLLEPEMSEEDTEGAGTGQQEDEEENDGEEEEEEES